MADRPRYPDPGNGTGSRYESAPRAPRWVWVSLIIAAVVALVAVIAMLVLPGGGQGGGHGPGRHASSAANLPSSAVMIGALAGPTSRT